MNFKNVCAAPAELAEQLRNLADPPESLQAELDVRSYLPRPADRDFRICFRNGKLETVRPSIWKQE